MTSTNDDRYWQSVQREVDRVFGETEQPIDVKRHGAVEVDGFKPAE